MNTKAHAVLKEALSLSPKARADIAGTLLQSLEVRGQRDVDEAWANEVDRRLKSIKERREKLVAWRPVKRRLGDRLRRGKTKA